MSSRESTAKKNGAEIEQKPRLEVLDGGKKSLKTSGEKLKKSEQDEIDELNFLLSHQSPQKTAKRIKEIADMGELETDVSGKIQKNKAPSIEALARQEGVNQIEEVDLTNEAREIPSIDELLKAEQEKIDNKIIDEKIETQEVKTIENKSESFNENLIDEVQKIHGNIAEEEKTQYVIDKLIARELEENNGEFADENLRADLKKLNVLLPSEIEFNKLLTKKENEDKPSKAEDKFFNPSDEADYDEAQELISGKEKEYDQMLISEQKKVDRLNRNDRFNFDNLLSISRTTKPEEKFKDNFESLTQEEQQAIIGVLETNPATSKLSRGLRKEMVNTKAELKNSPEETKTQKTEKLPKELKKSFLKSLFNLFRG